MLHGLGVVVTGAGSGIGRATARRLAAEGASVLIADIDEAGSRETCSQIVEDGGAAAVCEANVSVPGECERIVASAVDAFGRLDVLVNNAAICRSDDLLDIEAKEWDEELAVDLRSVYACSRAALRHMLPRRTGNIINITSVNALSYFGNEPYSAAKAGIISLTRSIAVRYGRSGIRCNAIAPGSVRTPAWDARAERDPTVFERVSRWYPLGRMGEPDDIANAVLFLASDQSAWITGVVLPVDGGILAGNPVMVADVLAQDPS